MHLAPVNTLLPPPHPSLRRRLLVFNPDKRLTCEQALRHPYVAQFHDAANEPVAPHVIVLPISDNTKYTVQEYRCGGGFSSTLHGHACAANQTRWAAL